MNIGEKSTLPKTRTNLYSICSRPPPFLDCQLFISDAHEYQHICGSLSAAQHYQSVKDGYTWVEYAAAVQKNDYYRHYAEFCSIMSDAYEDLIEKELANEQEKAAYIASTELATAFDMALEIAEEANDRKWDAAEAERYIREGGKYHFEPRKRYDW